MTDPKRPEPSKQPEPKLPKFGEVFPLKDAALFPDLATSCLLCYGHGFLLKPDLKYHKCIRCNGSGVDPKKQMPGEDKADYVTLEVMRTRMTTLAEKRQVELKGNKDKESKPNPDGTLPPSAGINGSSDLDI